MKRIFTSIIMLLFSGVVLAQEQPNIVFILADDLGIGDVSAFNENSKIQTPNIDHLVDNGMAMMNMHATSAVCTPSRYSILTGNYNWRSKLKKGVTFSYSSPVIDKGTPTVASMLKTAGYNTAMFGKWHLGLDWKTKSGESTPFLDQKYDGTEIDFTHKFQEGPTSLGFDYWYGVSGSNDMGPFVFIENDQVVTTDLKWMKKKDLMMIKGRETWGVKGWSLAKLDEAVADKTIEYIGKQKSDQPFFTYVTLSAPHYPYDVPEYAKGKSKAGDRGDMVYAFDVQVGKIVQALKDNGLYDNTVIIVTSDNGPLLGDNRGIHPFSGKYTFYDHDATNGLRGLKGWAFEGGTRIPTVIVDPRSKLKGAENDNSYSLVDFMAYASEISGAKLPVSVKDSKGDIVDVVMKGEKVRSEPIITHSLMGVFAIQNDQYKLIEHNQKGGGMYIAPMRGIYAPDFAGSNDTIPSMLFDLKVDAQEKSDKATNNPDTVEELLNELNEIRNK